MLSQLVTSAPYSQKLTNKIFDHHPKNKRGSPPTWKSKNPFHETPKYREKNTLNPPTFPPK